MGKKRKRKNTDNGGAGGSNSSNPQPTTATAFPPEAGAGAGRWDSLQPQLSPSVLQCIEQSFGFQQMTPVQASTIPLMLTHKDVAVQAVTGSGKTLAFVVPIWEMLTRRSPSLNADEIGAVIVAPARELARQIAAVVSKFVQFQQSQLSAADGGNAADDSNDSDDSDNKKAGGAGGCCPSVMTLIGGSDLNVDLHRWSSMTSSSNPSCRPGGVILVGTPGRLLDFLKSVPASHARCLEVCVLDEADRLLQLGFEATLADILSRLPKQRRTGLFSATQTQEVEDLAKAGLRNPVRVSIEVRDRASGAADENLASPSAGSRATPQTLANFYALVPRRDKLAVLVRFLARHPDSKIIVYSLTCACADYLWKSLDALWPRRKNAAGSSSSKKRKKGNKNNKADASNRVLLTLHGHIPQSKRVAVYNQFCAADQSILLCTDVAARGLDIPDVDWIVQFDPPQEPDAFVHRVGRTARMGRRGSALVLLTEEEDAFVEFLRNRRVPLQLLQLEDQSSPTPPPPPPPSDCERKKDNDEPATTNTSAGLKPSLTLNRQQQQQLQPETGKGNGTNATVTVASAAGVRRLTLDQLKTLSTDQLTRLLQQLALSDREVMVRGQRAYVSYVRAYKAHRLSYIFPFARLELGQLAHSFGLLCFPAMPELRGPNAAARCQGFTPITQVTDKKRKHKNDATAAAPGAATSIGTGDIRNGPNHNNDNDNDDGGGGGGGNTDETSSTPAVKRIRLFDIPYRDKKKELQRQQGIVNKREKRQQAALQAGGSDGGPGTACDGLAPAAKPISQAKAKKLAKERKARSRQDRLQKKEAKKARQTEALLQKVMKPQQQQPQQVYNELKNESSTSSSVLDTQPKHNDSQKKRQDQHEFDSGNQKKKKKKKPTAPKKPLFIKRT